MKKFIIYLVALIAFSCKKAPQTTTAHTTQSPITCQFTFTTPYLYDSTVVVYSVNSTVKRAKYTHNFTDSLQVNVGDIVKAQITNYSATNTTYSNQMFIALLRSSHTLLQTFPACTNCQYNSVANYIDYIQASANFTTKVQ